MGKGKGMALVSLETGGRDIYILYICIYDRSSRPPALIGTYLPGGEDLERPERAVGALPDGGEQEIADVGSGGAHGVVLTLVAELAVLLLCLFFVFVGG